MRNNNLRSFKLTDVTIRSEGDTTVIGGIAAPFNDEIKYQGQREKILPTAFDKTLAGDDDVRLFTDHSYKVENLLASRKSGNLSLTKTSRGLEYEATLPSPATDKTKHIVALAQRGELGASVGWQGHKETNVDGVRNYTDIKLSEISLTPIPAYKNTTVEKRSLELNNDTWIKNFLYTNQQIKRRYQR